MFSRYLILSSVLLLVGGSVPLLAQETVLPAGGTASGSGGIVSYSVGQTVYMTYNDTDGSVAEGVQQPYEISAISWIDMMTTGDITIEVFPNPAADNLNLEIVGFDGNDLKYQIYDITGNLVRSGQIPGNRAEVSMKHLASAPYFLRVLHNNIVVKTFKIIKN